jgi:hypothetical protein
VIANRTWCRLASPAAPARASGMWSDCSAASASGQPAGAGTDGRCASSRRRGFWWQRLGCCRRTSGTVRPSGLLKNSCAVLDDGFGIEEQKSAVVSATAVRDPEPPIGCQFCCDAQQTSSPKCDSLQLARKSRQDGKLHEAAGICHAPRRRGSRLAARRAQQAAMSPSRFRYSAAPTRRAKPRGPAAEVADRAVGKAVSRRQT